MTVAELIKMLEKINDKDRLIFFKCDECSRYKAIFDMHDFWF